MRSGQVVADVRRDVLLPPKRLLERSEQQRQRRPKLVTHVREERRLRAIELRERLGAAPLLLVGGAFAIAVATCAVRGRGTFGIARRTRAVS